jgi:D-alanyl-D-alanine carboxypeptidase
MQLRSEAAEALEKLFSEAKHQGIKLMMASAYRSYEQQEGLYNFYTEQDGHAKADGYSARPGHSEHQTGLAVDVEPLNRVCELEECFAGTPEGQWVAANAFKYGYIIRYEKGKKGLTGYEYEPWHLRYLGSELAANVKNSELTLEEYFKMPAHPDYPANIYQLKN